MQEEIYLDNSATTKPSSLVCERMLEFMRDSYYNSGALYYNGFKVKTAVEKAREIIANEINASKEEIYFTSGGTESNNLALFGAALARKKRGNKIIISNIEHSSVENCAKELENMGFDVLRLAVDENGKIPTESLSDAIDEKTILVSLMLVNNEIGCIQDIAKIRKVINKKGSHALLHTDAVQAFGKLKINLKHLGVDLMSLSAHKVHGPKGVGAIYIKKGTHLKPLILGGGQENGMRSGTLATELIVGFAAAVSEFSNLNSNMEYVEELNKYSRKRLSEFENVKINSPKDAVPYILNFSAGMVKSETLLHFLEEKGIMVSAGSTCSKGKKSRILEALKLSPQRIDSAIRISFSRHNTKKEIDKFIEVLREGMSSIMTK